MKDLNEILSHVLAIDKADDEKAISFYERKKNLEALACKVADELIAGRPVPVFNQAESITRIDGMLTQLANELVHQHDMAISHRSHLAERLEADGGENGAKAAAILRGMNAMADAQVMRDICGNPVSVVCVAPASTDTVVQAPARQNPYMALPKESAAVHVAAILEAFAPEFASMQRTVHEIAREAGNDVARAVGEAVARAVGEAVASLSEPSIDQTWAREQEVTLVAQHAANNAKRIEEAELRGFDKGRNQALSIVLGERKKWSKDLVRDVLGKVSEAIVYMQKGG